MPGSDQESERPVARSDACTDGETLRSQIEMWRPYLKRVAANVLGAGAADKLDASDVVQAALLRAVRSLAQFQGQSSDEMLGWLVAIVRNEAKQTRRFWKRERRATAKEVPLNGSADSAALAVDQYPTPCSSLLHRERAARIVAAVDGLREADRDVIHMRCFLGFSHREIADKQGRSEAAVRQHWVAALDRLQRELGDFS